MKKEKIIINYYGIKPEEAVEKVLTVINGGKISQAGGIKHYCWITVFRQSKITVGVTRKRNKNSADSFVVYK